MTRRTGWGSMAERVELTPAHTAPRQPEVAPGPVTPAVVGELPADVKHCWVATPGGPVPGLLLGWRHDEALGWLGRVVRPVRDAHGWLVLEDWLSSAELRPARGDPPDS